MKKLFHEPSLHKTAQEGMGDVLSKIETAAKGMYNPEHPVESVLAFIGPGLLWMLGFKWIAVLYEIAEALGFNWAEFFTSLKDKLKPFLTELVNNKSGDTSQLNAIVQEAAAGASSDTIDTDKLKDAVDKYGSLNNLLYMKKVAQRYGRNDSTLKSQIEKLLGSATGNRMRKGVLGAIIRIFSWVLSAVLISCGFAIVGGLASSVLGIKKKSPTESTETSPDNKPTQFTESPSSDKHLKLYLNPQASPELFTTTYNDDRHVWLLHKNIGQIKNNLIEWAQELYPQFKDKNAFDSSSAFHKTLQMFQERNKNTQLDLLAVPQPFKSIKEIVDSFAADVASHMSDDSGSTNI